MEAQLRAGNVQDLRFGSYFTRSPDGPITRFFPIGHVGP